MEARTNARLTIVDAGSPMGQLLRSYWIPLLYSHELPDADGPPKRVRLLGESLVAFRDSFGQVGLLDHHCPHRLASLFFGRNEEGGLRCAYHGWKFGVDGRCLDMPNEPIDCALKRKVRAIAYTCSEANGIIWTYMGATSGKAKLPPLPTMGWAGVPPERKTTFKYIRHCNWLQAMEGDLDSSHLGFLHSRLDQPTSSPAPIKEEGGDALRPIVSIDRRPLLEVADTPIGVMYAAARNTSQDEHYWRVTQFQLPFYTSVPAYDGLNRLKIWVPMDNEHTMVWEGNWTTERDLDDAERRGFKGRVPPSGLLPANEGWYGSGNFAARAENDYLVDRSRQRTHNFTGMEDETPVQDAAMQESMGAIVDRSREHLGPSDAAIIRVRRRLLGAVDSLEKGAPPGVQDPSLYNAHGEQMLVAAGGSWKKAYSSLMAEQYTGLKAASGAT